MSGSRPRMQAFWKTPPAVRCRRSRGSIRTGATSTHSASSKTTTTRRRTSRTAKTLFWLSTTRWRRARSGQNASGHLLRRARRLLRSCSAARSRRRRPADVRPLRRAGAGAAVSPWAEPGSVSHTLFDHTSIIKTILLRFCAADLKHRNRREGLGCLAQGWPSALPGNTRRTRQQPGRPSTSPAPRPAPAHHGLTAAAAARAAEQAPAAAASNHEPDPQPPQTGQKHIATVTRLLRSRGHPAHRT